MAMLLWPKFFFKFGHGEVWVLAGMGAFHEQCSRQLRTDPWGNGSSKSLVLKSFAGEGTSCDSSVPVSLTLEDTLVVCTTPLPSPLNMIKIQKPSPNQYRRKGLTIREEKTA